MEFLYCILKGKYELVSLGLPFRNRREVLIEAAGPAGEKASGFVSLKTIHNCLTLPGNTLHSS